MFLSGHSIKWRDLPELEKVLVLVLIKKRGILRILSAPARYIKPKIESAYKKLVKKEPKKTVKVGYNEEALKRKSIDELKETAKLRRIKNRGKIKKEGLITSLLNQRAAMLIVIM